MCRKCVHIWQSCVPGGGVGTCYLFEACLSSPLVSWESVSMLEKTSEETAWSSGVNPIVICYLLIVICYALVKFHTMS